MRTRSLSRAAADVPPLRISSPESLLEAIPYLLGFHPASSLVLVGLDESRLVVTVRVDLADLADSAACTLLPDAITAMCRGGASSIVGAIYGDGDASVADGDTARLPWRAVVEAVLAQAEVAGCLVLDVLVTERGRLWSALCPPSACVDPACVDPGSLDADGVDPDFGGDGPGRPLRGGVSEVAAAATYAGLVALPDRSALAALLEPDPVELRAALEPHIADAEAAAMQAVLDGAAGRRERSLKRAIFAAARSSDAGVVPHWCMPPDEVLARFGVALSSTGLRDSVWMAIDDGRLDGRPLWQDLSRRLPSPYDAAPLFLFGWCSWRAGNGALATMAAERAIASDPGYSAADLLLAALSRGVDPRRLPRLRRPQADERQR
jgi:hypothetical protein